MAKQDGSYEAFKAAIEPLLTGAITDREAFMQRLYLVMQGIAQDEVEGFRQRMMASIRKRDAEATEDDEG